MPTTKRGCCTFGENDVQQPLLLFGQVYRYPRHTVHPAIAVPAGISCRVSGWCACGRASKSVSAFADKSIRTCEKAVARQLSKNIVRNPELFQGQNGSKKVPGL